MIFKWLDAKLAKEFGHELALLFQSAVQEKKFSKLKKNKLDIKQEKALTQLLVRIKSFKKMHSLNFYQKAQLGNAFKWELREKNFDQDYIDDLTTWVLQNFR